MRNNSQDNRHRLVWKWVKGEATTQGDLADPTDTAHYSWCLYAGDPAELVAQATVPPDAEKWTSISDKGYRYKDRTASAAGVQKLLLKGGDTGKPKALFRGKGSKLPDPALPFSMPVIAQLVNFDTGVCLEGVYDSLEVRRNEPDRFTAKAR